MHFNFSNGNSASCLLYPNSNSGTELEFKLLSHLSSEWRRCLGNSLEVSHQMACSDHCLCPSLLFVSHFCFKHHPPSPLIACFLYYIYASFPFVLCQCVLCFLLFTCHFFSCLVMLHSVYLPDLVCPKTPRKTEQMQINKAK